MSQRVEIAAENIGKEFSPAPTSAGDDAHCVRSAQPEAESASPELRATLVARVRAAPRPTRKG
jgi:hypothetical protein